MAAHATEQAQADLCLCMSIVPGYSGQELMEEAYGRIERVRALVDCHVQVDGGVKESNLTQVREAGADLIVVGSGIFAAADVGEAYRRLAQLA